jgi:hypothetical protein
MFWAGSGYRNRLTLHSPSQLPLSMFGLLSSFQALLLLRITLAAFNSPTTYVVDTVQQNSKGVWCYYPQSGETRSTSCGGDFNAVLGVHLKTTVSIGYYGPDNTRYGGAEWSVPVDNTGKVTLCVSGRAGDGTYQTACMFVTADNSLPISGGCLAAVAQTTVTDGCYVPDQQATPPSSLPPPPPTSTTTSSTETPLTSSQSSTTSSQSSTTPYRVSSTKYTTSSTSATTTSIVPTAISQSNGKRGLSTSDIIAIVFGVITTVGVIVAIWQCC